MTPDNDDRIEHLLKQSHPPTSSQSRAVLQRDLWAVMQNRLDERAATVPWFDWALLAAVVALLVLFPRAIPVLLYHL